MYLYVDAQLQARYVDEEKQGMKSSSCGVENAPEPQDVTAHKHELEVLAVRS